MGDGVESTDDAEPTGQSAGEPTLGSLELEEKDLRTAIVDMSGILRARVGFGVIVAVLAGPLALAGRAALTRDMGPPLLLCAVGLALLYISPYVRARRLLQAIAKGGDRLATFRFDDEGFTLRTAGSTMTAAYRSLVEYREGKTAFLLYTSPGVANIVPKRAFSPEGLARVGALLAAHAKRRRSRGGSRIVILWFAALLLPFVVWQFLSNVSPTP